MKKKIRTANEEIVGWKSPIIFLVIYAVFFVYQYYSNGMTELTKLLMLLGLLFPIQYLRVVRRSLRFRQLHEHFMKEYKPQRGRIYNITKELPEKDQEKRLHYYLHIELLNAGGNPVRKIKSEAYYEPLHKYLASPEVDVYYDNQNKYAVVDGFKFKENENEPDIPLENTNVYDEMKLPKEEIALPVKIIWIGGGAIIAFQILLALFWK